MAILQLARKIQKIGYAKCDDPSSVNYGNVYKVKDVSGKKCHISLIVDEGVPEIEQTLILDSLYGWVTPTEKEILMHSLK